MRLRVTYFNYSLIMFVILSSITVFATIISPILDTRLVITSIMYCFLTLVVMFSLTLLVDIKYKITHKLFIILTTLYFIGYTLASLTFITTNQILRKQSFMFIYQIYPKTKIYFILFILSITLFVVIYRLDKRIKFESDKKKKINQIKKLTVISFIILLILIFVIPSLFNIFNPLVEMHIQEYDTYIHSKHMSSEKLIMEKTGLKNPNVIVILLESITSDRLGIYGYKRNVTPNMDHLAKRSLFFKNAYSTCTHSDYAQPGFLSSRYMLTNEIRNFFNENHKRKMVWDIFHEKGYYTTYFSSEDDLWAGMNDYFNYDNLDIYSYSLSDGKYDYGSGLAKKDYDHITMNKVIGWLDTYTYEKPFFMYMNLQGTHLPISYPDNFSFYKPDKNQPLNNIIKIKNVESVNNRYDNSIRYIDIQIGRLIDELNKKGIMNNTVILISSDHGHDFIWKHKINGHGNSVYNDELKVPLLLYIPDIKPRIIPEAVSHIDVIPTLIDILKIKQPKEFMGKPMYKNNRFFFYAQNHKHFIGMYKDDLKIIVDLNKKTAEVFNITQDPDEENNLINKGHYDEELLELLMWHNCQMNYFSKDESNTDLKEYCGGFLDK